jgi:Na+-translocating ferredoxin:NAD+ oxidoreductase RnfC subunit
MELDELKSRLRESGVVGAGGAGFPTYAKLSTAAEVVILNSAECEPLLRVDRQLPILYAEEILKGFSLIVNTLNAKKGIYAIKSEYKDAIASLNSVLHKFPDIEIKILDNVYPAGDEVVLVYETTGRIVPEGSIPITVGAVVVNTETVLNVYNSVFLNKPVVDKYVTVTGEVNNPSTIRVPIGTSLGKCIEYAGGTKIENYKIISGGPMTGRVSTSDAAVTKTTKAIIVLPEDHLIVTKKEARIAVNMNRAMSVCSQCRMCTDLCPRFLLGHNMQPHRIMNAIANGTTDTEAITSAFLCCECGICEMYACYQGLAPRTIIAEIKSRLRQKGVKNPNCKAPEKADMMRFGRRVPMKRLTARLGLIQYNAAAAIDDHLKQPYKVTVKLAPQIGAPAAAQVKAGDRVKTGDVIGSIEEGKLGTNVHASIDGVVTYVDDVQKVITIEARGDING